MANRKLENMKRQRGQVFILVLIALALGALLITPSLSYVSTGLTEARVSEDMLLDQYTADAAIEYSLWQLQYGLADQLDPENPSYDSSITVNGVEVPVTIEITQSPLGDVWPFPVPSTQQGIYLDAALKIGSPFLSADGQTVCLTHKVYMYNSGTSETHVKAVFQRLDPSFTYVEGSFEGTNANLTKTYVSDHWELYFDFTSPLPSLEPEEATFVSFVASTTGDIEEISENTYLGNGWVEYAAFEAEEGAIFEGDYAPTNFGQYYDISATSGSYTILVNVGITEEGEIIILSYQLQ